MHASYVVFSLLLPSPSAFFHIELLDIDANGMILPRTDFDATKPPFVVRIEECTRRRYFAVQL
jgi:hypothetical protein